MNRDHNFKIGEKYLFRYNKSDKGDGLEKVDNTIVTIKSIKDDGSPYFIHIEELDEDTLIGPHELSSVNEWDS